jgi:thiol-disulfide isomerase/thioredoxin
MMRRRLRFSVLSIFLIAALYNTAVAAGNFDVNEDLLAGIQLPIPENNAEKEYLGLSGKGTFSLSQVKARMLIVEVFSMYCPICQREAPVINDLHTLIEKDAVLKKDVKLIGIGIGNTPFEVEVYRKKFNVLFPLFADDGYELQMISKDRFRTPTFLVTSIGPDSTLRVTKIHIGAIKNLAEFLKDVKKLLAVTGR